MADALAGVAQLVNQPCFLVLGEGTGDLAHHLPRRVVACGQVIARGRQQPHPSADQKGDAQLLGHQLAREAAGILDDDGTHAVALDPIQKGREARPCLDRVGTGDRRIIELIDDLEADALGEALNGVALAFLAVLVRADVWFSPLLSPVISGFISDKSYHIMRKSNISNQPNLNPVGERHCLFVTRRGKLGILRTAQRHSLVGILRVGHHSPKYEAERRAKH